MKVCESNLEILVRAIGSCPKIFEVRLGLALEKLERPPAKKRQAEAIKRRDTKGRAISTSGKLPEVVKGDTRDIVGKAIGMDGWTYQRARAVVTTSERDDLTKEEKALAIEAREGMDRTGNVRSVSATTP